MAPTTAPIHDRTRLLLPAAVDHYATHTPARVYASIPINPTDLGQGFRDITYAQLSLAVDRAAHWLDAVLGAVPPTPPSSGDDKDDRVKPTFAYLGPRDLRYPIFVLAAIKVGRRILLPSHLAAPPAHLHLICTTSTTALISADSTLPPSSLHLLQPSVPNLLIITTAIPSQETLLSTRPETPTQPYPYAPSPSTAPLAPAIIFHTSGSSGNAPKPVVYTHGMLTKVLSAVDALAAAASPRRLQGAVAPGQRWHVALPICHVAGMKAALLNPVLRGTVCVLGPAGAVTADAADAVLRHGGVDAGAYSAALLEELVADGAERLGRVARLEAVCCGGAPLAGWAGDAVWRAGGRLEPAIGCTESMQWIVYRVEEPGEWRYFEFHEVMGPRMEERADGLFELVFERTPLSERWTVFFDDDPDVQGFRTKDLWSRHPTKPRLWKYQGRTDDLVVLTGEVKMYAGNLEEQIRGLEGVKSVLVGGYQRPTPFLLVEATHPPSNAAEQELLLDRLWPEIERENEHVLEQTRLRKSLALVAPLDKPFARLGKGSVSRRETFKLFEEEIESMYSRMRLQN